MKETLSALMDAELKARDCEKLLAAASEDGDLRAAWGRYHITRAVLRGEWDGRLHVDLSARVLAILADAPAQAAGPTFWGPLGRPRRQEIARFALAASLTAVAALFGLHMVVVGDHLQGTPPVAMKTALATPLRAAPRYIERAHWQGPRWRQRLNTFLLEHSAAAPLAGINGLTYVHLAAYNGSGPEARTKR